MPATMVIKPLHLMSDQELEQMHQAALEHLRQIELGRGAGNEEPSDADPKGKGGAANVIGCRRLRTRSRAARGQEDQDR
jgi:hypothetical protein